MFILHVRSLYISLVNTSYAAYENIVSGVHSLKYFSISHWNEMKYPLYISLI